MKQTLSYIYFGVSLNSRSENVTTCYNKRFLSCTATVLHGHKSRKYQFLTLNRISLSSDETYMGVYRFMHYDLLEIRKEADGGETFSHILPNICLHSGLLLSSALY